MLLDDTYNDRGINIILCLSDILPIIIISKIIDTYWNIESRPVLLMIIKNFNKRGMYNHHVALKRLFRSLKPDLLEIYPHLRFHEIIYAKSKVHYSEFKEIRYPEGLDRIEHPALLLIPGPIWDRAVNGDGIITYNYYQSNGKTHIGYYAEILDINKLQDLLLNSVYDSESSSKFLIQWFKSSISEHRFLKAQFS